jgi:hypothetical protein
MSIGQAELMLAAILRPINEGSTPEARPLYTFRQFVEQVYFPHCRADMEGIDGINIRPYYRQPPDFSFQRAPF